MRKRLIRRAAIVTTVSVVVLLSVAFCVGSPAYYSEKYGVGPGQRTPLKLPWPIIAEHQTEPHTCGWCSLAAVYKAYGLDPEADLLRFRLGTDKPLTNFVPSSKGTVHPDMLRVLAQDGFDAVVLRPSDESTLAALTAHLDTGHPAVVLIKVNDFHWVVIGSRDGDDVIIYDSLKDEPYRKNMASYLRDEVYSLLLVKPAA